MPPLRPEPWVRTNSSRSQNRKLADAAANLRFCGSRPDGYEVNPATGSASTRVGRCPLFLEMSIRIVISYSSLRVALATIQRVRLFERNGRQV
jgi:hypothetical protein